MLNDPKYKNLINDISGILSENIKKHFEEILPANMSDQVILAAEEIEEISEGARTAEAIGKIMKDNFYAAVREAHVQPTNEMSAEFYRRVVAELKMPKTDRIGRIKSDKIKAAYAKGSNRIAGSASADMNKARKQRAAGDEEGAAATRRGAVGKMGRAYDRGNKANY